MTRLLTRVSFVVLAGLVAMGCGPSSRGADSFAPVGAPGGAAAALVGPSTNTLRVEIDFVEGRAPSERALELLRQRLEERTDHPGGVEVVLDDVIPPTGLERVGLADLQALAHRWEDGWPTADKAVVHVLYLDGAADPALGHDLLGVAWATTSVALFPDAIDAAVGGSNTRRELLERWTLVHEAGHVLGLVGLGAPQVVFHQAAYHPGHCATPGCVMGWSADELATDFCYRCKDDLRAIGGR